MTTVNTVAVDRSVPLDRLRAEISTATTAAQTAGIARADVVLTLLQHADQLCEIGEDVGDDMSKLATAFGSDADV
jgi:hypothetical protein